MSERPSTVVMCSQCGRVITAARNFCPYCGASLAASPAPPDPRGRSVADFYSQLSALQRAMAAAFSQSELKDVAFALGVFDFASLPGETKEDKARELIGRMVREDRLPQLLALCRRERPAVVWPFVEQGGLPAPPANPLDALFRQGIRHQLQGELAHAQQAFEGIQRLDPNFPGLQSKLAEIQYEMRRFYVAPGGEVDPDLVLHPPPMAAAPPPREDTKRLDSAPQPPTRGHPVWPILIAAVAVLVVLVVLVMWLVGR